MEKGDKGLAQLCTSIRHLGHPRQGPVTRLAVPQAAGRPARAVTARRHVGESRVVLMIKEEEREQGWGLPSPWGHTGVCRRGDRGLEPPDPLAIGSGQRLASPLGGGVAS